VIGSKPEKGAPALGDVEIHDAPPLIIDCEPGILQPWAGGVTSTATTDDDGLPF
jgi:hypothetical protein